MKLCEMLNWHQKRQKNRGRQNRNKTKKKKKGQQIENSYKCDRYKSNYVSYDLKCEWPKDSNGKVEHQSGQKSRRPKIFWQSFTKITILLPYYAAIVLLQCSNLIENLLPHRNIWTNDIAALFIITKNYKQTKYLSIREWVKKMWCIHK